MSESESEGESESESESVSISFYAINLDQHLYGLADDVHWPRTM